MNTFFKAAFLIIGICLVLVLLGIYTKLSPSRYQIVGAGDHVELLDTRTNDIYYNDTDGWHKINTYGDDTVVKQLPK